MPEILVLGAGVCGLAAATLLARDGHAVTVVERDPAGVPASAEEAWSAWRRGGVAQFRQAHFLQPRGRQVLDAELPDVHAALLGAGGVRFDGLGVMPRFIADRAPRPDDDRFVTLTARRTTVEHVVARAAEAQPGLEIRRGVRAAGLLGGPAAGTGTPHVAGIRTEAGDELRADLVVDAMGRGSRLPRWLRDCGAAPPYEEAEDCGFAYYTRHFRATPGAVPQPRVGLLTSMGSFSILTLPGDRDTWSVSLYGSARDRPLKRLRDAARWTAVVRACPLHAHWLDGEPMTGVLPMGGVIDRHRRLVVGGRPVATGVALVADASACTNPSAGRGIALGLVHAVALRDVVRTHLDDPHAFAEAWDAVTEAQLTPWYRAQRTADRARLAEIDALRAGVDPPAPRDPEAVLRAALQVAMVHDADVFRAALEMIGCLALPRDVLARPGLVDRILEVARAQEPVTAPGPGREELVRLVA
jgi:2-polyprenyl-6-methoxyphenol hydroxylase-like FAD-dependent oxidoreductase